jgi:hypothetical protein
MVLSLTAISQDRWQVGVVVTLGKWLAYYLGGSDYTAHWAKVGGGVTVYAPHPQTPPEESLSKPRLILRSPAEEQSVATLAQGADPLPEDPAHTALFNCTYLRLSVEAEATTDDNTGGELTCLDLLSAVRRICELHASDLAQAGLLFIGARPGETTYQEETGLWVGPCTLTVEFALLGEKVS